MNFDKQLPVYVLAGFVFIFAGILADAWTVRIPFMLLGIGLLLVNVFRLQRERMTD